MSSCNPGHPYFEIVPFMKRPRLDSLPPESEHENLIVSHRTIRNKFRATLSWTIDDFLNWIMCRGADDFDYKSPPYSLKFDQGKRNLTFVLEVKPDSSADFLSMYLHSENNESVTIESEWLGLDIAGNPFVKLISINKFGPEDCLGFKHFISLKSLKARAQELLPYGALKLECRLVISTQTQTVSSSTRQISETKTCLEMQDALDNLWKNNLLSDFNLVCGNKIFPCHRAILASRSDVFEAMFNNKEGTETLSGQTIVQDFDPDMVGKMVEFIYRNKLSKKLDYCSTDLLLLADKYNIVRLRLECEKALAQEICLTNVLRLLSISNRISAPMLLERSARFIFKHLDQMVGGADWNQMVECEPESMNVIFKHRQN